MIQSTPEQQALIQVAKVLSHPVRLQMLEWLSKAKMGMCSSFTRKLGVSQPLASKHLKKMLVCGIVQKERVGKTWLYSLNQKLWEVVEALQKAAS